MNPIRESLLRELEYHVFLEIFESELDEALKMEKEKLLVIRQLPESWEAKLLKEQVNAIT